MVEIRFHARAGQGAKTAAQILAEAALKENQFVQAFPNFGPARRGAPVSSFVRLSEQPIDLHSQVTEPDFVVAMDPSLLDNEAVAVGVTPQTKILINSPRPQPRGETLDASKIAQHFLGKNRPNLVMLGALVKKLGNLVSLKSLEKAITRSFENRWGPQLTQKNILALRQGYQEVR